MIRIGKILIRGYQLGISPLLGTNCKHFPSCSEYGYVAIDRFGMVKGGWLTLKRVARCGPNGKGGFDPVPDIEQHQPKKTCTSCNSKTR